MNRLLVAAAAAAFLLAEPHCAAQAAEREPYGIALEGFAYPYPVHLLPLVNDGEQVRMAYMDVAAASSNGRTVVLLHGRNFPSSYWAPVIQTLTSGGYRVVVPDQIGFGKSSKPQGELPAMAGTARQRAFFIRRSFEALGLATAGPSLGRGAGLWRAHRYSTPSMFAVRHATRHRCGQAQDETLRHPRRFGAGTAAYRASERPQDLRIVHPC